MQEISKPEPLKNRGGFWIDLDGFQIHVGTEDAFARTRRKAHLAYEVEDLDAWREKLEKRGIETIEGVEIPNCKRFEFRDPFGNRVEFLEISGK